MGSWASAWQDDKNCRWACTQRNRCQESHLKLYSDVTFKESMLSLKKLKIYLIGNKCLFTVLFCNLHFHFKIYIKHYISIYMKQKLKRHEKFYWQTFVNINNFLFVFYVILFLNFRNFDLKFLKFILHLNFKSIMEPSSSNEESHFISVDETSDESHVRKVCFLY